MSTVFTPRGYCVESDIENLLLLNIDSSFSAQVNTWIASAEAQVDNYLGYTTSSGIMREEFTNVIEDTATIDTEGNLIIFPRKTPLVSVSAVSLIKGTDSITLTLTTGGSNKYQIPADSDTFIYPGYELAMTGSSVIGSFMDMRFTKFFAKMSYVAGYETVPADIHMATVNLVADTVMRHANKDGLSSVTQGAISKSWYQRSGGESDFVKDARALLDPYKISTTWIRK